MLDKTQGDSLPAAWSGIDHLKGQARTFKYLLNDMETLAKLKKQAVSTPVTKSIKRDNSVTLQFSTGAYITAISPLVKFYKETEGKNIKAGDVDGLSIYINSVWHC